MSLKHSFIPLSTITILIDWQIFSVKRFKIDVKKRQTLRVLKWLTFIETNCNKLLFLWFTEEQDDEDNKSRIVVVYLDKEMTFEMVSIWVNILLEFVYSMYFLILLLLESLGFTVTILTTRIFDSNKVRLSIMAS